MIVGTLQLTERNEQALLDQARNHENPCKIKQFDSVLRSDDAGNLAINWQKHGGKQTLIKPMETSFSVIVGTLQLTERNKQALLDQARNYENLCKSLRCRSVLGPA